MDKLKILTVFGTRPEAIKMAPLVKQLNNYKDNFHSIVCVSAQHREMLDQVLGTFGIEPDFDLNVMEARQTLTGITKKVLEGLDEVISEVKPNIILVHGDTTTTFAASLAAFYQKVTIGHVEAGLRTFNKYSPFPEEVNRQLTGCMADLHFAPTLTAADNLINEGKNRKNIFITGNTVIDAMKETVRDNYSHPILDQLQDNIKLIFMTAHRRENFGQPMENIFRAILRILEEHNDVNVVYPMHWNPAVREPAIRILGNHPRINLIDPLDVIDTHNFMARSYLILTDSGGIQEEAPSLGIPVIVLRDTTERPEGVKVGTLKLAGIVEEDIYKTTHELLNNKDLYRKMSNTRNPYGDGHASSRIAQAILHYHGLGERPKDFHD